MPKNLGTKTFCEADMYKPVKDFFTGLGYTVNAEVMGMDIAMQKDGVLTVIELKKSLNMTLLIQAVDRQSITGQVFAAVPKPLRPRHRTNRVAESIVKRLGLGLIYVDMASKDNRIEIVHFPNTTETKPKSAGKKRRERVTKELEGRSVDVNRGGQTGKPIATAYRERAVKAACALERGGALTVRELRSGYGLDGSVSYILRNNHHGWFERVSGGKGGYRYGLSAKGIQMLLDETAGGDFMELVRLYRGEIDE